jgi:proteasome lid subunit RPN8/RPN11
MDFEPMPVDLARTLVREAQAAAPNEMCGFVIAGWSYIPIPNSHPEPDRHFNMDEVSMLDVLTHNAHEVLGVYHSHPSGRTGPSPDDIGLMRNYSVHGFRFWIVTYNNVYEWRIHDDEARPVRRDGTNGSTDLAYPVLTTPAPL